MYKSVATDVNNSKFGQKVLASFVGVVLQKQGSSYLVMR